jgi:hypothetical protein
MTMIKWLYVVLCCVTVPVSAQSVILGDPSGNSNAGYGGRNSVRVNSDGQVTRTLLAGEDQANDVIKVEGQYSVCIDDADIVCKAEAGFLHSVWCFGEDAASTAGRVRLLNAAAAGAAETTEVWGHEFGTGLVSPVGQVLDIVMSTGIVIDFTTTADVKCGVSYR